MYEKRKRNYEDIFKLNIIWLSQISFIWTLKKSVKLLDITEEISPLLYILPYISLIIYFLLFSFLPNHNIRYITSRSIFISRFSNILSWICGISYFYL